MRHWRSKAKLKNRQNNRGAVIVEVILILVVVIALVVLFKAEITGLVQDILENISSQARRL